MKEVMKHKKRVGLYIRVSSDEQAEKYGDKVQESQMLKWLEAHSDEYQFEPKHTYKDLGYSGASEIDEREALPRLFDAVKRNDIDIVMVWKLDRFFRKTRLLLNAIEHLTEMGVGFIATTQTEINTTTNMGRFMLGLLGIIAEMERDLILERTASGREAAAEAGKWVGGKYPPYGYDVDPTTQKMSVNPEEEEIVKKIFNWYVKRRMTAYEVQQRLNGMKIATKADKKFEELKKKKADMQSFRKKNPPNFWHVKTITRILRQEAYTGTYYFNKRTTKRDPKTKKKKDVANPRELWRPIRCSQIINRSLWEKAQEILAQSVSEPRNVKHEYLLSGKVHCGRQDCKSAYGGYIQPKWKQVKGKKTLAGEYCNYRCKRTADKSLERCNNRQISGQVLEAKVWSEIESLLADPKSFIERVQAEQQKTLDIPKLTAERDACDALLEEFDQEYVRACNLYEKGLKYQKDGEIEAKGKEIEDTKAKITSDRDRICSELMDEDEKKDRLMSAEEIAKRYAKELQKLDDFDTKRRIVQELVMRIEIFPERVRIELLIPRHNKVTKSVMHSGDTCGNTRPQTHYVVVMEVEMASIREMTRFQRNDFAIAV